jgi:hypothetical protein
MDTLIAKFDLKIDYPLDELLTHYAQAIGEHSRYVNGREEFSVRRSEVLKITGQSPMVEAIVIDAHEKFFEKNTDQSKWQWEGGHIKDSSMWPSKVPEMLKEAGGFECAGVWELACFGYLHPEYFRNLKHNPRYLIAPRKIYSGFHPEFGGFQGPAAVSTGDWAALMWHYAEPTYPRVLGIRAKR